MYKIFDRFKTVLILVLVMAIIFITACGGETKYTYEEYRKLKAFQERQEYAAENDFGENAQDLDPASYYRDLENYDFYMGEFTIIYNDCSQALNSLYDSFDSEQQDLDRKNDHAQDIKQQLAYWSQDLSQLDVPDIMLDYHNYILEYLDNEILFYDSFLQGDPEAANRYMLEAARALENGNRQLEEIEASLRNRAGKLGADPPP